MKPPVASNGNRLFTSTHSALSRSGIGGRPSHEYYSRHFSNIETEGGEYLNALTRTIRILCSNCDWRGSWSELNIQYNFPSSIFLLLIKKSFTSHSRLQTPHSILESLPFSLDRIMSSLPSRFDHTHHSLSVVPIHRRIPSPSIQITRPKTKSKLKGSGCEGSSVDRRQDKDGFRHNEYEQIFDKFVHYDDLGIPCPRKDYKLPELKIDDEIDRLTCVFEMEFTEATPLSTTGELNCPPWPLEALGFQQSTCEQEDFEHISCGHTDCGYENCNPPTPGQYVFTPLPDDLISVVASDHESTSPMPTHFGSPISTLELDSPLLKWTPDVPNWEESLNHMALDPIFTQFSIGGLPTPDTTPTKDYMESLYPLFEARCESPRPAPVTLRTTRPRTTTTITEASKKRLRKRDEVEANIKKKRRS